MPTRTYLEGIRDALREEMERDSSILVLGEDVGKDGGVFRVTDGLLKQFGETRVIDTPLAEAAIVGVSIGAAANGLRPVAEIQFADFIHPAMEQIMNEAAKIRYRSNGDFGCPIVIRSPYGAGGRGGLYHSQSVEGLFAHIPGLKVVAPSTPYDAKGLLKTSIRDDDPVLYFEHKMLYRRIKGDVPEGDYSIPLGLADVKRSGDDVSVVTYGGMVHLALQAAEALGQEGISVEVLDLRSLVPLDREAIGKSIEKTSKALVLYEDNKTAGFGAEVAAIIAEEFFDYLDGPVVRVAAPDTPVPYNAVLEQAYLPKIEDVLAALRKLAAY